MPPANHNRDLTLAYVTFRPNPKLEWWLDSLQWQADEIGAWPLIKRIVIVTPHKLDGDLVSRLILSPEFHFKDVAITWPCPGVWQGPHRLTKADYFDVANARNTAIALAPTSHIVFSDDLSVLMPGWLQQVVDALNSDELSRKIVCGAYRKVNKLNVVDGKVASFEDHPPGIDHRTLLVRGSEPQPCRGQWAFGCSLMAPIEALLSVNGYDQDTASLGYEDVVLGQMLEKRGHEFVFAPRMMTYESEELHHDASNSRYIRWDPGVSPNDKSHAMLNLVANGRTYAPNYYGESGLRGLREHVLRGGEFPIIRNPQHEWFTGTALKDLPLE
jgi:hypothetical protein